MNSGVRLWKEAKSIIPGGNQLLSKRSEMFLPEQWPSYYKRAKGCEIWDLDDIHYYDFASLGVGSCVLGYADDDVNAKVKEAIDQGSMGTLNSFEEVALAKKLIELHPWAEMVRFSRSGGEACAIAVRIARAASGRDKVAFCGYHGWHDWYLSANIGDDKNLDGQLLPGLEPNGVPRSLRQTSLPFRYNALDELEKIFRDHSGEVGVVIMEPARGEDPADGFLQGVRALTDKHKAVLIFDEVTSGFRMTLGGIHLRYNVMPDIAVFGKALGNGFPISAVIGRKKVMDAAQTTFISSTFWTERNGFVAGLETIAKMKRLDVPRVLTAYGRMIQEGWEKAAYRYSVPFKADGIAPLPHMNFIHPQALALQTFFTQEMLKKGFLASGSSYTTYAYSPEIIGRYLEATDEVFSRIGALLKDGADIAKALEGPVKHAGFKRLT